MSGKWQFKFKLPNELSEEEQIKNAINEVNSRNLNEKLYEKKIRRFINRGTA